MTRYTGPQQRETDAFLAVVIENLETLHRGQGELAATIETHSQAVTAHLKELTAELKVQNGRIDDLESERDERHGGEKLRERLEERGARKTTWFFSGVIATCVLIGTIISVWKFTQ